MKIKQQITDLQYAWFWALNTATLFIGIGGKRYPDSFELEPVVIQSPEEACAVFMRNINPYAHIIPAGRVPLLCYKQVYYNV